MNSTSDSWAPQPKLKYRFTCFIARGDLDDQITCSDNEENESTNPAKGQDEREIKSVGAAGHPHSSCSMSRDELREKAGEAGIIEKSKFDKSSEQDASLGASNFLSAEAAKMEEEKRLIREGFKPLDGSNQQIYSVTTGVPPKTFLTRDTKYDPKCPPPTYMSDAELINCRKSKKEDFMAGFEIPKEGGLHCIDEEALKRQSGVLGDLLAQMFTKFSIERVSLPVRIFEPRSTLERCVDLWRFAPYYLGNAAASKDPVERLKQVIAFAVAGMYCSAQQLKPFNPLLGETFEATFSDGTKIYLEHTSHHPPQSHFLLIGPNNLWRMYGYHIFRINMGANTLEGQQEGPNTIEFADGQKITFRYPKIKIHGMIWGKRMIYPSGVMTFDDPTKNLRAAMVYNYGKARGLFGSRKKNTKIDDFDGIVYYAKKGIAFPKVAQIEELDDVEKVVGQITGSWIRNLKVCGTIFWDINRVIPYDVDFISDPLPSDWRWREDLIWLRRGNMPISQVWKERLEHEQRTDEKVRSKFRNK